MSPSLIARTARERGLRLVALTDHNATFNCLPYAIACGREGVLPLFGLELNSAEEVHLLAIFATPREALAFGADIYPLIPALPWNAETFGDQAVVDEDENVLDLHQEWLGASLKEGFNELAVRASGAGAIVIPAHIDRGMFSVHSQLGFLPPGPYDAVESIGAAPSHLSGGLCVISGSDAHYPEHIGRRPFAIDIPEQFVADMQRGIDKFALEIAALGEGGEGRLRPGNSPPIAAYPDFGTYAIFLEDPRLDAYPEKTAHAFFEATRRALHEKKVIPTHVGRPLVSEI